MSLPASRLSCLRLLFRRALAAVAGALLACSFAPIDWWPLAVLCPAVLMWLWQGATPREGAWLGFWFNAGTFAAGTYWLYISIHIFGEAPAVGRLPADDRAGRDHGAVSRRTGLCRDAVAAGHRRGALVFRGPGRLAADRMVARLVSVGLFVAVARLFADRHLARELRADRGCVWHQRDVAVECRALLTAVICGTKRVRIAGAVVFVAPWIAGRRTALGGVDPSFGPAGVGRCRAGLDLRRSRSGSTATRTPS